MLDHGIEYRDYQSEARDATFAALEEQAASDETGEGNGPSSLVVMPTGTGKTVLAGMMVEEALYGHGRKARFIAHREVLINQAYKTLSRFGFDCAIEMAGQDALKQDTILGESHVVVGSIQTLQDDRLMRWNPQRFGLIIIDECHRALTDMYTKTLIWFEGSWGVGITATPKRGDYRNLGTRFRVKSYEYSLRRAIAEQWLAPIRVRTCKVNVDLRGLKTQGNGDFSTGDLEERIGPRLESIARGFSKEIGKRPAVAFLPDVGSAMAFAQVLTDLGVPSRYVAGTGGEFGMKRAERKVNLEAFNEAEYQVIVCCELLIEGWDCPRIEAVGIIRPTNQQYRYTQMVGRGTRPSPDTGKVDCLVVDFDWETDPDVKDLCSTIDLFDDGTLDEEVYAEARRIEQERAVDVDPVEVIEEAERIVRTRRKFMIKLTGKEAEYATHEHDPVGVSKILDIKLNRKYDLDKRGQNPATEKQIGLLRSLGLSTPENLSKWGASKMIDKLMKRRDNHLATATQVQTLLTAGVNSAYARVCTAEEASQAITELDSIRPKSQMRLF